MLSTRACLQTPKVISINRFRQDRSITAKPQTRVGGRAQMVKSGRFCPRAIVCKHALVVGLVSLTFLALTDGPETSADADWVTGDDGITHNSTVYYDKDTDPFVAYVDKVYWGARPAENLNWNESGAQWQREPTLYKVWDDDSWDTEASVDAGPWRSCGSSVNGLCWWNLNNDVTLEGAALVYQRLRYAYYVAVAFDSYKVSLVRRLARALS